MKPLKLNMSKFKKVASDKTTTTLQHPAGHTITIAHGALPEYMQKEIKNLPNAEDAADASEQRAAAEPTKLASGGNPKLEQSKLEPPKQKRMAEGGNTPKPQTIGQQINYPGSQPSPQPSPKKMKDGGSAKENYAAVERGANAVVAPKAAAPTNNYGGMTDAEDAADAGEQATALAHQHDTHTDDSSSTGYAKGGVAHKHSGEGKFCTHCGVKMLAGGGDASSAEAPDTADQIVADAAAGAPSTPAPSTAYNIGQDVRQSVQDTGKAFKSLGNKVISPLRDLGNGLVGNDTSGNEPDDATPTTQTNPNSKATGAPADSGATTYNNASAAAKGSDNNDMGMTDLATGLKKDYAQQAAGVGQEAAALGQQGAAQAKALDTNVQAQQQQQNTFQDHFNHLNDEYNSFVGDVKNQQIDPDHYWNSKSTGSKIATGIGLILGGLGGGLGHTSNAALEFLNNNVNRDINAQKANLGKSEGLLSANMKQFGNMNDAASMTRIMQQGIIANQLEKAADTSADPLAQARAQQNIALINKNKDLELQQLAQRRYMMGMMSGSQGGSGDQQALPGDNSQRINALRMLGNEPMAKALEEKSVPGVGTASVPVPSTVRDQLTNMKNFHSQMSELRDFAKTHSGDLSPTDNIRGKAMAQAAQNSYRQGQDMGVFKQSEVPLLEGEIPNKPTEFLNKIRVLPAYDTAINNNARRFGMVAQSYGLPTAMGPMPAQQQSTPGNTGGGYVPKSFKPVSR